MLINFFDESGDGFARSEAIGAVLIQKRKDANRSYATIRHVQSNADGAKQSGFIFPSAEAQEALLREMYEFAEIDPGSVKYVDAHGTGTPG